jgi:predicted butyrate kinase (DUF1464 family)
MARVIGIDPGTVSFDLCGLDDGHPFLVRSAPSEAARDPEVLLDQLTAALPLDLIAAPSGYGLPLATVSDVSDRDVDLIVLVRPEDRGDAEMVGALRPTIELMRARGLPAVILPGVVHLPTVPPHRKVNRIDMGTADKVCVAALGIWDQARRLRLPPSGTAFILVELGGAFSAGVAVRDGQIVDGIGGSGGGLGYRALGTLDGEVAYLRERVSKSLLFSGGAAYVAGAADLEPETWIERVEHDARAQTAWWAFLEAVEKVVAALRVSLPEPREVLLSGRLSRVPGISRALAERLAAVAPVSVLGGFVDGCKEGAQGAALLADGLAGGPNHPLVEALRLREAQGTVLDHLYVDGIDAVRRAFGLP